ncbi:AlpA family transcriptional regulator [Novosphingobium sp. ST904]|uniref:helix-turn-helix transcriptional regulator n=1 Tax=Novosphingobium sp. ST904 TaxID=1684385 RepID=UPI0009EA1A46|nr:AlpA family transcriptional regulator [Novosphingobium sp. ST904]
MATPPNNRLIRLNDVLHITGLSRSTLYRKIDEGTFPKQIRIAARCTAWRESDVVAWVEAPLTSPSHQAPSA